MGCDRLHSKSRQSALQARKIDYVKHSHKRLFSVAAEGAFYSSNIVACRLSSESIISQFCVCSRDLFQDSRRELIV
jgi:hypothetical protein